MPEGPEVHRKARSLRRVLVGRTPDPLVLLHPKVAAAQQALDGRAVTAVDARGKAFLLRFEGDLTLYVHLQLYGRWVVQRRTTAVRGNRALRVGLYTDTHAALLFSATHLGVHTDSELRRHPYLAKLGPDALDDAVTVRDVHALLESDRFRRRQLAGLLLDQGFVAGVGNYLRSEILFCAGIRPKRRPCDLGGWEQDALAEATLAVCRRALAQSGVTTDPELVQTGKRRGLPRRAWRHFVFGRAGAPCWHCGTAVVREVVASRRLFYCPSCQV